MHQITFDPFDYENEYVELRVRTEIAKAARNAKYHELRGQGRNVTRFTLTNQLEKYQSFGVDGRGYRNVYFIQVNE